VSSRFAAKTVTAVISITADTGSSGQRAQSAPAGLTDGALVSDGVIAPGYTAEALAILQSRDIQLLLTDINMPLMTGVELLRKLAGNPRWSDLTRVVISTDGSALRREEVAGLDVRCYLEKPFTPEVMRNVLTDVARPARA